jgi:membrane protease YdiL (CAAX protease family)
MIGGFSPTIASYVVLKKNKEVTGFKEWLKNIFSCKTPVWHYLLVAFLMTVYFSCLILISGLKEMNPIYVFFVMLPVMMLVGGGNEEVGWRYILHPELGKKYGFILSSILVAVIWAIWHLPLFFIPGVSQYGTNFGLFSISILGYSFVMGAIRKVSGKVFLCVLAHGMANAGFSIFIIDQNLNRTLLGSVISTVLVMAISTVVVFICKQRGTGSMS